MHGEHLARLRAEQDNLRSALRWCLSPGGDAEMALTIASSLWWFWWLIGQLAEGRQWLERALAATARQPPAKRARALRAVASLARSAHDLDAARRWGEDALAAARQDGDPVELARALNGLCMTANAQHDLETSLRFGVDSRRYAEAAGDKRSIAVAANNVGVTLRCLGRIDEADELFQDARERFAALNDRRGVAATLYNLAIVARRRGVFAESRRLCLAALSLYHDLELREGEADVAEAVAYLEVAEGRPERALRLLEAAAMTRQELGAPVFTPDEIADRDAALAAARAMLGDRADTVQPAGLPDLVTELLSATAPDAAGHGLAAQPADRQVG
jgi:tetratricopeptide (TPR) repeat protein